MIKLLIPKRIRLLLRLFLNLLLDIKMGYVFNYAKKRNISFDSKFSISISQDLKPNDAKLQNLLIAKKAIEELSILPTEVFSFWKTIGAPSAKNGFQESRSIVGTEIKNSVGGGLCQLSGLIYYISLMAGLEIIERHNHSMDIYDENTRFTPLGADATVVYGYKDLRIKNNLEFPIRFTFIFEKERLTIRLNISHEIPINELQFEKKFISDFEIEVKTIQGSKIIDRSVYKKQLAVE